MNDNVSALPIERSRLRLYCLRISDSVLIAGNGGLKDAKRYEDGKDLNGYVVSFQKLDRALKNAVKKGIIIIEENNIKNIDKEVFEI